MKQQNLKYIPENNSSYHLGIEKWQFSCGMCAKMFTEEKKKEKRVISPDSFFVSNLKCSTKLNGWIGRTKIRQTFVSGGDRKLTG